MIFENNKPQFAKEIEKLLKQTRALEDIEITYGSVEYIMLDKYEPGAVLKSKYDNETEFTEKVWFKVNFTPSERNLTDPDDGREFVQIKIYHAAFYQSVEADSYWGMVLDIVNRLRREGY